VRNTRASREEPLSGAKGFFREPNGATPPRRAAAAPAAAAAAATNAIAPTPTPSPRELGTGV
jgi:hypothetical protein